MNSIEHDDSAEWGDGPVDGSAPELEIFRARPASVGDLGRPVKVDLSDHELDDFSSLASVARLVTASVEGAA